MSDVAGPSRGGRRIVTGVLALVALVVLMAGVPLLLTLGVGNPWPGRDRIELGDTAAVALGAVAAVAWIVWARFSVAVMVELPTQWRAARAERRRDPTPGPVVVVPPSRHRGGIGMVAARLVAAVLVLFPVGARLAPTAAAAPPLTREAATAVLMVDPPPPPTAPSGDESGPPATSAARSVVVADGDTLRGLARRHLGDPGRWRDIFELNHDRVQPGGARLVSPSGLQVGWSLTLPADAVFDELTAAAPAPASPVAPAVVTVAPGDTLWALTRDRLVSASQPAGDADIAAELRDVVAANPLVVEDPDLIFPGEQLTMPAIGVPPGPPPSTLAPVAVPAPRPLPPPVIAPPVAPPPLVTPAPSVVVAAPTTMPSDEGAPLPPGVTASSSTASERLPATSPVATPETTETTESTDAVPRPGTGDDVGVELPPRSPIGLGEAALLSTGVLALVAARRRRRLRAAEPRARLPEPPPEQVVTERRLRAVDARERLIRVDVAIRAAAASLVEGSAQPAVVRVGTDGAVELTLTADATLPAPWQAHEGRWVLPGSVPVELVADAARRVGAPCIALTQIGVDDEDREVMVDLEALGVLTVHGPEALVDAVVRGIAATLASSIFAEPANLIGVGLDDLVFLDHRLSHRADGVEAALELATTLVGTTASARQSTFVLRARHTSGESWEPAVVVVGSEQAHEVTPELLHLMARRQGGLALVVGGDTPEGAWSLVADGGSWRLEPLGLRLTPVGLSMEELTAVYAVLHEAERPLLPEPMSVAPASDQEPGSSDRASDGSAEVGATADDPAQGAGSHDPPWSLLVRLLGEVDVVDRELRPIRFERAKTLELLAWLTQHRGRSTRAGARAALWELDVRDATFANVVSEARRALARHVAPPEGEEWLARTLTEQLPLHDRVVADVDLVRARLDRARLAPPQEAIELLRPAVELVRGLPFAGTGYLWPDPEGTTSELVLLATSVAAELAGHYLSVGDVDGVFWATGRGLAVLPGHEELIALRMRAHHRAGDLAGVRQEWESYERVLDGDAWGDGEPAPKLVDLRRELLAPSSAEPGE